MLRSVLLLTLLVLLPGLAAAERRVALVIANAAYEKVGVLANPIRDAEAVSGSLRAKGFEVTFERDLDLKAMRNALKAFREAAAAADVALVYYAGHGIEVDKENYLIPKDAAFTNVNDIPDEAVSLSRVREVTQGARRLRIVLLDACRDNPFAATLPAAGRTVAHRGLGRVEADASEVVVFAAAEGEVAADGGSGANSPFAAAFTRRLEREAGTDVRFFFGGVVEDVRAATKTANEKAGRPPQTPAVYNARLGASIVALVPEAATAKDPGPNDKAPPPVVPPVVAKDPCADASAHWSAALQYRDRTILREHLEKFGKCNFASLARHELDLLDAPVAKPVPPPPDAGANQRLARDAQAIPGIRSYWVHNGSLMGLRANGRARAFVYLVPRAGIAKVGVRPGDVLFEGTLDGDAVAGNARIFDQRCGAVLFPVSGIAGQSPPTYSMSGTVWTREAGCQPGRQVAQTLDFAYVGLADPVALDTVLRSGRIQLSGP